MYLGTINTPESIYVKLVFDVERRSCNKTLNCAVTCSFNRDNSFIAHYLKYN